MGTANVTPQRVTAARHAFDPHLNSMRRRNGRQEQSMAR
jgi:hypothetical protein